MYESLQDTFEGLDDAYGEAPIRAAADPYILYAAAIFLSCRVEGDVIRARRTWHKHYARGDWLPTHTRHVRPPTPVLTN